MNISELLVETLARAGVVRIFAVVGDSLDGIADAVRRRKDMQWITVRHEEVAAFAAGAEAHLTGTLAVCAGSCGPGNTHLINGLYDCHRSRVPVLAIAAHIPSAEVGSRFFQETHPETIFKECSSYCELVSHPSQMPRVLEIAIQTAIGQNAVSVVVLPGDVALLKAERKEPRVNFRRARPLVRPSDTELDLLAGALSGKKKITILGGAGCAGAHDELVAVAERLQAPIVHALRGKEFIEYDNPYDVGLNGLLGIRSGFEAMEHCEALLMLGTDFPYQQFYPTDAWVCQVDLRPEQLGRRARLDLGLIGDVKDTLAALLPRLQPNADGAHLAACQEQFRKTSEGLLELAVPTPADAPVHPQYLARCLSELASDDAIFTADVGTPSIWAARYLHMNGRRRLVGSWSHGSMAGALPQAIGAQLAFPERQVITLSGDGGFAMLMGDLLSVVQHRLPIKIVIFNNGALAFVELELKAAGILGDGTELVNPDFAKLAEAVGIKGMRVDGPGEVKEALRAALAHPGPVVIDVRVNRQELSMPPTITLDQAVGFNLYAIKAIINGRGDEILDMATSNMRQVLSTLAPGLVHSPAHAD